MKIFSPKMCKATRYSATTKSTGNSVSYDCALKKQQIFTFVIIFILRSAYFTSNTLISLIFLPIIYRTAMCTSVQFSSVAQSGPTLCNPMTRSMPGLPVHHQLPEFTQTHVHRVSDAIQPSHPLSSPFPPAPNPSQHQSLFQ